MLTKTFSKSKIISGISLIAIGVIGRLFLIKFVGIPNFEIITALTLVSVVFLGRAWGIIVPLSIIAITDVALGNSPILIFTWSAFAIIGVFGMVSRHVVLNNSFLLSSRGAKRRSNPADVAPNTGLPRPAKARLAMTIVGMTGLGIVSSVFFFLYTNFGWWLMSNMYPHTFSGLMQCYVMGLPFFKNNLIGDMIFVPMFSSAAMFVMSLKTKSFVLNVKKIFG